ncbi:unnamed protein product [Amoebophrya sp. A25]|nr:unnamed protein product [Amoebophrya sp. A25]|eukprot:GSA25T00023001001.1
MRYSYHGYRNQRTHQQLALKLFLNRRSQRTCKVEEASMQQAENQLPPPPAPSTRDQQV